MSDPDGRNIRASLHVIRDTPIFFRRVLNVFKKDLQTLRAQCLFAHTRTVQMSWLKMRLARDVILFSAACNLNPDGSMNGATPKLDGRKTKERAR